MILKAFDTRQRSRRPSPYKRTTKEKENRPKNFIYRNSLFLYLLIHLYSFGSPQLYQLIKLLIYTFSHKISSDILSIKKLARYFSINPKFNFWVNFEIHHLELERRRIQISRAGATSTATSGTNHLDWSRSSRTYQQATMIQKK